MHERVEKAIGAYVRLSRVQRDILGDLCLGHSDETIAERRRCSPDHVEECVRRLEAMFDVDNRVALAAFATEARVMVSYAMNGEKIAAMLDDAERSIGAAKAMMDDMASEAPTGSRSPSDVADPVGSCRD